MIEIAEVMTVCIVVLIIVHAPMPAASAIGISEPKIEETDSKMPLSIGAMPIIAVSICAPIVENWPFARSNAL